MPAHTKVNKNPPNSFKVSSKNKVQVINSSTGQSAESTHAEKNESHFPQETVS